MNELGNCVICGFDTERMACPRCQARIGHWLTDILEFTALAHGELLPGRGGDGRSTERSIGVRVAALDLVAGIDTVGVLESWERDWRETFGLAPYGPASAERNAGKPHGATLSGVVRFLRTWLDRACAEHPAIDDFHHEVKALRARAQGAANRQPRPGWTLTCPADVEDGECGASIRITGEDFGGSVTCRSCRSVWTVDRLIAVAAASRDAELWIDQGAAMRVLDCSESTLKRLVKDGRVTARREQYDYRTLVAHREGA